MGRLQEVRRYARDDKAEWGPGRPAGVWWLGFDCAHYLDVTPASDARLRKSAPHFALKHPSSAYRSIGYVEREMEELADQLKAMERGEQGSETPVGAVA